MNKKIFLAGALALSLMTGAAHAEQPAAEEYRRLFGAGTFYLEYRDENLSKAVKGYDSKQIRVLAAFDKNEGMMTDLFGKDWSKA